MSKKKLSILIYSLSSGGAERVVSILLNELKNEFNITLFLMNKTIFHEIPKEINIIYLENSNPFENGIKKLLKLPLLAFKYKKICKNLKIDVSLSFMNRPNYINTLSKLFGNRSKVLISERAMPSLQHKYGIQGKINRVLIKYLYNISDKIIANSLGNSKDLIKNFSIKKEKLVTIYNPIEIERIKNSSKEKLKFNFDRFTFVTIGRLDIGKNHKFMIEAFSKIENKKTQLLIIGDGELKNKLETEIKNLNLEDRVFLLGRQKNPYKYLLKSDCFLFSSKHEGFPNVLLEALACELPIISSDCKSGPREILAPNSDLNIKLDKTEIAEYGILYPVDDEKNFVEAINTILNNQNLVYSYKKEAKIRLNSFRLQKIKKQFIKLI